MLTIKFNKIIQFLTSNLQNYTFSNIHMLQLRIGKKYNRECNKCYRKNNPDRNMRTVTLIIQEAAHTQRAQNAKG